MIHTTLRDYILTWGGLMLLLVVQAIGGRWLGFGGLTPFIGALMAGAVAMVLMHLRHGTGQAKIFAFTGALWLVIMLVLTMTDLTTRTASPLTPDSAPTTSRG